MRLLHLSPWFPFPPGNGSELRISALLRGLAAHHSVTLISFQRRPVADEAIHKAREILAGVQLVPWREFDPGSRRSRAGLLSSRPRSVVDTYSEDMEACIRQTMTAGHFEAVIVSELVMAAYWPAFEGLPALLEDIELAIYSDQVETAASFADRARRHLMWRKQSAYVRRLLPHFRGGTVVSPREQELLARIAPNYKPVRIVPNGIDFAEYSRVAPNREAATLIFTGAFTYQANYEAMIWFLEHVYPLVRRAAPAVRLIITGDHAGKPLPPAENVILTGFIDDIKTAIAGATICVVPILQGGGTRLKILEAMALGTPVISTTKGAEGLDAVHGQHLLLADTPDDFAAAILGLLSDAAARENIAKNACRFVQQRYDWANIIPEFLALVETVAKKDSNPDRIQS